MRKALVTTIASLLTVGVLAGCGGVNREATKQKIIEGLAGQNLPTSVTNCVANTIDKFTDDELKQLDANSASAELKSKFQTAVTDCVTSGLTPSPEAS